MKRFAMTWRRCAVLPLFAMWGCSSERVPTAPDEPAIRIADIVLNDVASGDVAYSHSDHWHGALRLAYGEARPFRMYFVSRSQASHDAPPQSARITLEGYPEYRLRIDFEDATLVRWVGGSFEGTFVGQYPGGTRVVFSVWRGATEVFRSPPVGVVVRE